MYKNLSPKGLGVSGRQSELIELAMTFGYRGFDLDMQHFVKQSQRKSVDYAQRFIESASKFAEGFHIGGWELPTRWDGAEATFKEDLNTLSEVAEIAGKVEATRCHTFIQPASDSLAYHENFELHRQRLAQVADVLAPHDITLGLGFRPAPEARKDKAHEFIHDAEGLLTLCSTIGAKNVGVCLDTWSWYVGGGGVDQLRDLPAEQIVIVRVADVPGDADMASLTEKQRIMPSDEGLVDCDAFAKMLHEIGYDGPVTPYIHPGRFVGKTRDNIVQAAAKCLEQLWIAAGITQPKPELVAVGASASAVEGNGAELSTKDDGDEGDSEDVKGEDDKGEDDSGDD